MKLVILSAVAALCLGVAPASAEMEVSLYSGWQTAPHSRASGDHPDGGSYNALIGWEGRSFEAPPYYGVRGTWWRDEKLGFGLEFTHAKVYAPDSEKEAIGFNRMEFTDGINLITVNAYRRWQNQWRDITPYVGGGIGLSIPHVDVESAGGEKTFGYQVTGPAVRLLAGVNYDLSERFAVFGEYQFTYSNNEADLDGGGSLETEIKTNALNFGVTLKF
ncbi:outer membrane protein [Primorskyibacter flagellatus]|uniref:Lipid A oxidase n=1 Tax=Primorskyibacter flagellatus TaxID=1387277 RepID=A0A1W1ZRC6_9RHOB|nr:outer membrane beta-barrel protein [Primorskyibacter flagellatus]SMC51090.1 lipid A oxidase [Primorskyibacter flagellatus]